MRVEDGQKLYIANALLNSSAIGTSAAIVVAAGGSLVLGEDQPGTFTGTVTIGNDTNKFFTDGWDGIICETGTNLGCTITDAPLTGKSSVVIEGQEDVDLTAQDFANITLTSAPRIGVAPGGAGFGQCPAGTLALEASALGKPDVSASRGEAVLLEGQVTMNFSNGTVQCISGTGFLLEKSPNKNGNPSLTLLDTTIQNTERAVFASAGKATISRLDHPVQLQRRRAIARRHQHRHDQSQWRWYRCRPQQRHLQRGSGEHQRRRRRHDLRPEGSMS